MGCGICGFVGLSDKKLLQGMCEVIRHRGPDSTGYFLDSNVGLGIDRLSIIDLAKGDQPIHNEDGSVWTVFNGEIYNYLELRAELERLGHRFYTESDTETVVHSYEQWGDDCVRHFRGMFGLAIWDSKKRRLFLARDRFGKKPVYYALVDGVLLFGSEIKAILRAGLVERSMDMDALDYFLSFGYVPEPLTIFKGISKLPAGHVATFDGGKLGIKKYWDFTFAPDESLTEAALVDQLYAVTTEAVKVRMRSDVPLGAFLSGGIDSSTVVSIMSRLSSEKVKTVSIGFDEKNSELPHSRVVAQRLGTDHEEFVVRPEAHKILPNLVWHFDEPFSDSSMIPTYYLSQVTRSKVTVALSGDGGDELFMGYGFLADPQSFGLYGKVPKPMRNVALKAIKSIPVNSKARQMASNAYEKDYGEQPYDVRYAMRMSMYDSRGLSALYSKETLANHGPKDPYARIRALASASGSRDELSALDYATIHGYLEDQILVKVDRMSMAVSLEVRCPLLDQELAELVGRIPSRMKVRGATTKYILKKMALEKGLLPASIVNRKKQGFGAPIEAWMQGEWKEVVDELLDPMTTGRVKLFDPQVVKRLATDPYVNSGKLFALSVFMIWHKMYLEEPAEKMLGPPQVA